MVATGFWQRAFGLFGASWRMRHLRRAGRAGDAAQQANIVMVFPCCASVHTFFMGCAIDIAFIGRDGTVLQVYGDVRSGRVLREPDALAVIERL